MTRFARAAPWTWVVGGLGLVLLLLLFADWYDFAPVSRRVYEYKDPSTDGVSYSIDSFAIGDLNGWGTGEGVQIVVVAFSILCMARALLSRGTAPAARSLAARLVLPMAALITVGCLAARIAWSPDDLLVATWGLWASLVVAVAILLLSGAQALAGRPRAADG